MRSRPLDGRAGVSIMRRNSGRQSGSKAELDREVGINLEGGSFAGSGGEQI